MGTVSCPLRQSRTTEVTATTWRGAQRASVDVHANWATRDVTEDSERPDCGGASGSLWLMAGEQEAREHSLVRLMPGSQEHGTVTSGQPSLPLRGPQSQHHLPGDQAFHTRPWGRTHTLSRCSDEHGLWGKTTPVHFLSLPVPTHHRAPRIPGSLHSVHLLHPIWGTSFLSCHPHGGREKSASIWTPLGMGVASLAGRSQAGTSWYIAPLGCKVRTLEPGLSSASLEQP